MTPSADDSKAPPPTEGRERLEQALFEIRRVIAGQDAMLERVLVCLLAQGHLLIEGVPGLAKTLTIKTTAASSAARSRASSSRPTSSRPTSSGTRIYRPGEGRFDTELGPVFCNFLLADEINRAPAKVQSALLEVMQERQVTIGHDTHPRAGAVPRDGDAEPDRVGGDVSPSGGADRPLHAQDPDRLPVARRGADDRAAPARGGARAARDAHARRPARAPARGVRRLRRPEPDQLRGHARRRDAQPGRARRSTSSPSTSSTAPARAGRSASSSRRGRSRSCTAATTSSSRTCARSRRTRSATGSCSPTRRSPRR